MGARLPPANRRCPATIKRKAANAVMAMKACQFRPLGWPKGIGNGHLSNGLRMVARDLKPQPA